MIIYHVIRLPYKSYFPSHYGSMFLAGSDNVMTPQNLMSRDNVLLQFTVLMIKIFTISLSHQIQTKQVHRLKR